MNFRQSHDDSEAALANSSNRIHRGGREIAKPSSHGLYHSIRPQNRPSSRQQELCGLAGDARSTIPVGPREGVNSAGLTADRQGVAHE